MQKRGGDLRILETLGALTQRNEGNTPTNDNDEPPTTTMTGTSTKSTTWKMLRGAGLAIVVGLAGMTAVLGEDIPTCADGINSDDCMECNFQDENPWCGDNDDPVDQMSCTPFEYRPMSFNNIANKDGPQIDEYCSYSPDPKNSDDIWATLAYDDTLGGWDSSGSPAPWPYPGVRAWAAQFNGDCSQAGGNSDYWVFHACDGAGIQGGDCKGDIKYVERFGWNYYGDMEEDFGYCNYDGQPWSYDNRMYCRFVHPGTNKVYEEYKAGWTGFTNDKEDTFWAAKGLPTAEQAFLSAANGGWDPDSALMQTLSTFSDWAYGWNGGKHPYTWTGKWFSFPMFAWRADYISDDHDNNKLSYPTIAENGWKVYADNEPGDTGAPPEVDFILGGLTWDDDTPKLVFDMWRSDADGNMWKLNDEVANGTSFVLYPVHENDGSCAPW